jgi:hypothetical protein
VSAVLVVVLPGRSTSSTSTSTSDIEGRLDDSRRELPYDDVVGEVVLKSHEAEAGTANRRRGR